MAKFCINCGTRLDDNARFCTNCGTQVVQIGQTQQPTNQQRQKPENRQPAYQQSGYQQPAYKQTGYWYSGGETAQAKKGKGGVVLVVILLIAAVVAGAFIFRGCGKGGSDAQSLSRLNEYARQLEEAGNPEAAAAVYELIAQGGEAEFSEKAHEDIPLFGVMDDLEQLFEISYFLRGGDGE